jgi:hypothetical protein
MEERILTQHPENKQGVNISREKYEQIRDTILTVLKKNEPISFQDLNAVVFQKLDGKFEGSIGWYFTTVKLDLEARGRILCERKSGQPQMIHLSAN